MIYIILAILILLAFLRTVSFSVYQVRMKNYTGAIALFLLVILSTTSAILNLLT